MSQRSPLDAVYAVIARLFEDDDQPELAMSLAEEMLEFGEDRSWAAVWWAYGAIHHELTDEAYARALKLLERVQAPAEAKAAAYMLTAEIESTQAIERGREADAVRHRRLLADAVELAPDWPNLRVRLAHACLRCGSPEEARAHGRAAVDLLAGGPAAPGPAARALAGHGLSRDYVERELADAGLAIG